VGLDSARGERSVRAVWTQAHIQAVLGFTEEVVLVPGLKKAAQKYRQFHLKEPNQVTRLSVRIPKSVYAIGYCLQISYRSNKWNDDDKWLSYIHWWEHPTLVCVPKESLPLWDMGFDSNKYVSKFDLGSDRNEVTFLGNAIDINVCNESRSHMAITGEESPKIRTKEEVEKIKDSIAIPFSINKDFVVCSPSGNIVYVISESEGEVFAFINTHCKVTSHGIEG
jgi:hypothetical protein